MLNDKPEPTFKTGSYAWFHFANKGKQFQTNDGVMSKLEVFCDNKKNPDRLEKITRGKCHDCIPIDKIGWKDGVML